MQRSNLSRFAYGTAAALMIFSLFGLGKAQLAHATAGIGCQGMLWYGTGQKVSAGQGPNYDTDANGHCDSAANIYDAQQNGNTYTFYGEMAGGGDTGYCSFPYDPADEMDYIASAEVPSIGALVGGKGESLSLGPVTVVSQAQVGGCVGTYDTGIYYSGSQYYATFTYNIDLSGYSSQNYLTYLEINPGGDSDTPKTYSQCVADNWADKYCENFYSYWNFTPTISTGTINVHANINAAAWCAYNSAHQWQASGTSGSDPSAVASQSGTPYSLDDYACELNTHPYGFSVASIATYHNPPSILARIIKTAEASTCTDWICALTNGGTISYTLTSEYCKIYVNASINDPASIGLAGVSFTVSNKAPYINSYSGTTGSSTTSFQLLTDKNDPNATPPSYPQDFDFATASLPATITVGGNTADFSGYTITRSSDELVMSSNRNNASIPTACAANDSLTFNATYKTRAILDVH